VSALPLILTVFVACAVEAVEALTIVLAAGLTREWRSTFQGMAAALAVLAVVVAVLGPTITLLPLTNIGAAVIGAVAAVLVVTVTGIVVRAPLARVPENALKFAVGVMLTSFGIFWGAEGAGVSWPGHDAALLVLVPVVALVALGYTVLLRRPQAAPPASAPASEEVTSP